MELRLAEFAALDSAIAARRDAAIVVAESVGASDGARGTVTAAGSGRIAPTPVRAGKSTITLLRRLHGAVAAHGRRRTDIRRRDDESRILEEEVEIGGDVVCRATQVACGMLTALIITAVDQRVSVIISAIRAGFLKGAGT
jgi:hypothetical protein